MTAIHDDVYAAYPRERIYTLVADLEAIHRCHPSVPRAAVEGRHSERCALVPRSEGSH